MDADRPGERSYETYVEFFYEADTDFSGWLDLTELTSILRKRGFKGTDRRIKEAFSSADLNRDGQISLEEYLHALQQHLRPVHL